MRKVIIYLIKFYRKYISKYKRVTKCVYTPTCSQYAIEVLEKYGIIRGGSLAIWRVLKCNPFARGGYDPVP